MNNCENNTWDKVFPLSETVSHKKVSFQTQYGFTLVGDLYWPNDKINDQMVNGQMVNIPDSHHGSLKAPVLLKPADDNRPYKIIENDHVVIIRNSEKYDVTGKKL